MGCIFGFLLFLLGWYFWGKLESYVEEKVEEKHEETNTINPYAANVENSDTTVAEQPKILVTNTTTVETKNTTTEKLVQTTEKTCAPSSLQQLYRIIMERKGYLIHVTEAANLPSILKYHAILSMNMLEKMSISPDFMSSDVSRELDRRNNTKDYVKLAFDESYPMFNSAIYYNRLKKPAIILIHPRIILEKPVKIAPKNSASNDYFIISNLSEDEKIKLLDFDKIYRPIYSWSEYQVLKNSKQAEILVKDSVPVTYFMKILVPHGYRIDRILSNNVPISFCDTRSFLRYSFADRSKGWWW